MTIISVRSKHYLLLALGTKKPMSLILFIVLPKEAATAADIKLPLFSLL
jgi:hypothetical protein